jgi:hypothetical protein
MTLRRIFSFALHLKTFPLALLCIMTGLAQAQNGPVPPAPSPGSPVVSGVPGTPARPPETPAPKPFKEVIKDAKDIPGLFRLYRKDEKVWMEIRPEQLDTPFFFSYNIPQSIGERGLYGSQMGGSELVHFRKIGNHMQLIAKNTEFFAKPGTPQAQFVSESFSDSLLASAPVVSLPHPDTKGVLVEANALLFADIPGYLTRLELAFRVPYALDTRNTSFSRVNNSETMTGLLISAHFSVPKLPAPPLTPPPAPTPPPPRSVPDPRSLFAGFYYSFLKLPAQPMAARIADERLGHFVTSRVDYTEDVKPKLRAYYVNRWRIEKKDPGAAVSDAKEPVVYWLDKNIPEKYRKSAGEGVLEWNKAFEKAGIRGALAVKQQTGKDDFDTMDVRHASIRWFTGADIGFAIGPSQMDPRTGEILDADIGMSDVFARGARRLVAEDIGRPETFDANLGADPLRAHKAFLTCNYMAEGAQEMHFAMDLLEARGIDMDSPEADVLAQAYVKDVVMHEVGHTLGLRHNFRSSTIYSLKQLEDPAFTKVNGITGSVMDYTPFNLAAQGEKQGEYVMSTLGPYDFWAIEYAYRNLDAAKEKDDLAKIAARSTEPLLAFATDEDAGYGNVLLGIDPDVNRFDLGGDPIEYYVKRMKLSRELWNRLENMQLKSGESYERLTRSLASGFAQLARVAPLAAKYVGGVRHFRDRAGSGRPLYEPTPTQRQREALKVITGDLLQADSFKFKPEFVSHIGIDHFERNRDGGINNPDISIARAVLNVQRAVLDQLYDDHVAARLLDSQDKVSDSGKVLKLSELYDTVQDAVWSELKSGRDISSLRRNLQREHLRRVSASLIKPSAGMPADARSLQRENALQLQAQLRKALKSKKLSRENHAHLGESLNTLTEALKAPLQRVSA